MFPELKDLKVGSYVKISTRYGALGYFVTKIARETPKRFLMAERSTYYEKTTGRELSSGGYWFRTHIITGEKGVVTPEEIVAYESRVAYQAKLDAARKHTEQVSAEGTTVIARQLGLPESVVKVQASTSDGFVTVTYTVEIKGLSELNLKELKGVLHAS